MKRLILVGAILLIFIPTSVFASSHFDDYGNYLGDWHDCSVDGHDWRPFCVKNDQEVLCYYDNDGTVTVPYVCTDNEYHVSRCQYCYKEKVELMSRAQPHIMRNKPELNEIDEDSDEYYWAKCCDNCNYEEWCPIIIKKGKSKKLWNKQTGTKKAKEKTAKSIKWKSSNKMIVTVNKKTGKLKAKKRGTAYVTVRYKLRHSFYGLFKYYETEYQTFQIIVK